MKRSLNSAGKDAKQKKITGFFAKNAAKTDPKVAPTHPTVATDPTAAQSEPKAAPQSSEAKSTGSTLAASASASPWTVVPSPALSNGALDAVALANGTVMPVLGFGTYRLGRSAQGIVANALKAGYRLIDTAQVYDQGSMESAVGAALKQSGLPRSSVFISTKVWRTSHGFEKTLQACNQSLARLGVDYVDLYMVHWPGPQPSQSRGWTPQMRRETWKAMEKLLLQGKAKAIGVCNHSIRHLKELFKTCEIKPMVNQVWFV